MDDCDSNGNGLGYIWWTDKLIYICENSIEVAGHENITLAQRMANART